MVSLEGILKTDLSYPGIEIKVELIVLSEYLSQMEAGISSVCEKYIEKEMSEYQGCEYAEYQHIYTIAEDEMPRIIRMPFVVTIYTLFENSASSLLAYAQKKEEKELSLKDINGKSLISTFNKYMKHVLEYDFQFDNRVADNISKLNKIRNCIAHTNGSISSMSESKIKELQQVSSKTVGIDVGQRNLDISEEFLIYSMDFVCEAVGDLMKYMESKYGWV